MSTFDCDVKSARFEADGRLTVEMTARLVEGDVCKLHAAHLAKQAPDAQGGVAKLASIEALEVTLDKDRHWEGALTWPLEASAIARGLGSVIVILEPVDGEPVGVGFEFQAAAPVRPARRRRGGLAWLFLAIVVIGVAIAVTSRTCS